MRNYAEETSARVEYIRAYLKASGARGIVYGNSGGKDSALVGILCKMACENTVGIIMPCASKRNYGMDKADGLEVAEKFGIETRTVDLTPVREAEMAALKGVTELTDMAVANIAPRLRMTTLYAVAHAEGRVVAGTGNASNPIADLTVGEIYAFLEYLDAPRAVIEKAPSAGLFEGQTDESEMGISYADIDKVVLGGEVDPAVREKIERMHAVSEHKRRLPACYGEQ